MYLCGSAQSEPLGKEKKKGRHKSPVLTLGPVCSPSPFLHRLRLRLPVQIWMRCLRQSRRLRSTLLAVSETKFHWFLCSFRTLLPRVSLAPRPSRASRTMLRSPLRPPPIFWIAPDLLQLTRVSSLRQSASQRETRLCPRSRRKRWKQWKKTTPVSRRSTASTCSCSWELWLSTVRPKKHKWKNSHIPH